MTTRPLVLHASALNDQEYPLYLASLRDLAEEDDPDSTAHDDAFYENLKLGVREVRAWLRGRYASLPPATVDAILKLFSPALGHADLINGGQFFAVLRLTTHVLHGKHADPSLVFVQAHPDSPSPPDGSRSPPRPPSDPPAPDLPPSSYSQTPSNPFFPPTSHSKSAPPIPSSASTPAAHDRPTPPVPPKPKGSLSTNPFLSRRQSADLPRPSLPFQLPTRSSLDTTARPPLPPRKPTAAPPPPPRPAPLAAPRTSNPLIQQSLVAGRVAHSLKKAEERLEKERVLEVLKSSHPRRARSSSPTKDPAPPPSKPPSAASSSDGRPPPPPPAGSKPSLPPRKRASPPGSVGSAATARSLEQVAQATLFRARTLSQSPVRASAPPTHPDRKPPPTFALGPPSPSPSPSDSAPDSPGRASPRMLRSRSMHQPAPPPLLPPPRRRPGSVQLTPSASAVDLAGPPTSLPWREPPASAPAHGLSRHMSLSSPRRAVDAEGSPIAQVQRALAGLHQRAQPALESARFKAEAGLTRRGFVQHGHGLGQGRWAEGEERLVDGDSESEGEGEAWRRAGGFGLGSAGADESSDLSVDDGAGADEEEGEEGMNRDGTVAWQERLRRLRVDEGGGSRWERERAERESGGGSVRERAATLGERDNLKWPAGEGWTAL